MLENARGFNTGKDNQFIDTGLVIDNRVFTSSSVLRLLEFPQAFVRRLLQYSAGIKMWEFPFLKEFSYFYDIPLIDTLTH